MNREANWPMRRRRRWLVAAVLPVALLLMAAAASAAPARISLVRDTAADGSTRIVATVTDEAGEPVEGSTISFLAKTAFGWLRLAEVETAADGTAALLLPAEVPYPEVLVQSEEDPEVRAGLLLAPGDRPAPARRPGLTVLRGLGPQPGFISPYPPVQILFVAVILGGIWTTYAYLVSLLIRIRRAP